MRSFRPSILASRLPAVLLGGTLTLFLVVDARTHGQGRDATLHIGSSGTLAVGTDSAKEKSALSSLRDLIKTETGMSNEILHQQDWRELADKMTKGQLQVGVFQGYEFAWARGEYPALKPLALAANVYTYPIAHVLTKQDNRATDFAGLQGQSLSLPATGQRCLKLFVERQALATGKKLDDFFSKIASPTNVEDAIDDVVDGVVQAAVIDQASLEAYKRRKPGRFKKLKEVARSQPFPPVVVATTDKALDEATQNRFRDGLLNAKRSDRGQTMLTMFRLTGFERVPEDFAKLLTATREAYPSAEKK